MKSNQIKVYYAAAMLGDRSNLFDNKIIFKGLEKRGYSLLTEFVIDDTLDIFKGRTPREIFERDIERLDISDVLVADISFPSTGVGFEIAYGLLKNKKVIAICREDRIQSASALIRGITWDNFILVSYRTPEEAIEKIDNIIRELEL
ncbi:MAG: hypothetical protein DRJ64_03130 [Thermoprotei archaeon]|nr:MAG: hypothetical protein DRJ64_03130 [Thermoprotei archaeon]